MKKIFLLVIIASVLTTPMHVEAFYMEAEPIVHRSAARMRERQSRLQRKQDNARPRATSTRASMQERARIRRMARQTSTPTITPTRRRTSRARRTNRRVLQEKLTERTRERRVILANKKAVLKLINEERTHAGLLPLTYSRSLEHSAQLHTEDMMKQDYFSHISLDGKEPEDRIRAVGYLDIRFEDCNCSGYKATVGENIAKGQRTAKQVVDEWMESTLHRKNILSGNYKEMGVGLTGNIWAQHFGGINLQPR